MKMRSVNSLKKFAEKYFLTSEPFWNVTKFFAIR